MDRTISAGLEEAVSTTLRILHPRRQATEEPNQTQAEEPIFPAGTYTPFSDKHILERAIFPASDKPGGQNAHQSQASIQSQIRSAHCQDYANAGRQTTVTSPGLTFPRAALYKAP
jgi:hypothetical protein